MRSLFLAMLLIAFGAQLPAHAADFDYYVFSLSWSPKFCHENVRNKTTACNAQAKMNSVVRGYGPLKANPIRLVAPRRNVISQPYEGTSRQSMPGIIFKHVRGTRGVCSATTETQKIARLFGNLAIPVKNTGKRQQATAESLRQKFSKAKAGTKPNLSPLKTRAAT